MARPEKKDLDEMTLWRDQKKKIWMKMTFWRDQKKDLNADDIQITCQDSVWIKIVLKLSVCG